MDAQFDEDWTSVKRPYARYALGVGLAAWGAVALALFLQHVMQMEPCPWCTLQRLIFIVLGLFAFGTFLAASTPGPAKALAGLTALIGISGLAAALWQHFVAASTSSCDLTLADRIIMTSQLDQMMPWMFQATAMCDEANLPMLGVPFALWSAMLFVVLTLIMLIVTFSRGPLK